MSAMTRWDDTATQNWLTRIGLGQYSTHFAKHNIRGDVLAMLDNEYLAEVGVDSIGHRIRILKAVGANWQEVDARSLQQRLELAEAQLQKMTEKYEKLRTDMMPVFRMVKENEPLPSLQKNVSSTSIATTGGSAPTSAGVFPNGAHGPGPTVVTATDLTSASQPNLISLQRAHSVSVTSPGATKNRRYSTIPTSQVKSPGQAHPSVPSRSGSNAGDSNRKAAGSGFALYTGELTSMAPNSKVSMTTAYEPYKSFRVEADCPCYKLLPGLMRHYRIVGNVQDYRLVVQYGDHERMLSDHEIPLLILKELQDNGVRATFMVRQVATGAVQSATSTPGGVL